MWVGEYSLLLTVFRIASRTGDFPSHVRNELEILRDKLVKSGSENVNWKDFVVAFMDKEIAKREENIKKVFQKLNKSGRTHLSVEDVADIFGGVDQAQEIFDYVDADGDGRISLQDFQTAVESSFNDAEEESEDGDEFGGDDDDF